MLIPCPGSGPRDRREFTYYGHATFLARPAPDAGEGAWDDYLHNRDNPAGLTEDLWYHDPCGQWLKVKRDTVTHRVHGSAALGEGAGA